MKVEIFESTDKFPLQKIGKMAGVCWGGAIDDVEKNIRRAKDCIVSGHGRTLEYVDIELCLDEVSARVVREWYTHIAGGPTRLQQSTRYVNCAEFKAVMPPSIEKDEEKKSIYENCLEQIRQAYKKLEELDTPREDIANILPLGMFTKIVDKRNLRNLTEMFHQRSCSRAYWEYRQLMAEIKKQLSSYSEEWKWICENLFIAKCEVTGFCTEKKSCGRRPQKN